MASASAIETMFLSGMLMFGVVLSDGLEHDTDIVMITVRSAAVNLSVI